MIAFFFLALHANCWCPLLHQVIARQFSDEYFPDITETQRNAFVLGAIYADGVDKSITHNITRLRAMLNKYDSESEIYWFFMGNVAHIAPDMFAHAGRMRSFIVSHGLKHHLSEVAVDSLIAKTFHPPYLTLTQSLTDELTSLGIKFVKSFSVMYPSVYLMSKFPLYKTIPAIQNNICPRNGLDVSILNFFRHYDAMLECLRMVFPRIMDETFNYLQLQETTTALVFDILCYESQDSNETKIDNLYTFYANFYTSNSV